MTDINQIYFDCNPNNKYYSFLYKSNIFERIIAS